MLFRLTVGAVACAYVLHVFRGEFVYEDATWLQMVALGYGGNVRPRGLTYALWSWEWALFPGPQVYHAVSLLLHALNAVLVGVLAFRIGLPAPYARLAAGIMFVHWLGIESVAYAAQQGELLAATGVLGACIYAADRWWKPHVALGLIACLVFGMWAKESAAVGIGLVILTAVLCKQYPPWHVAGYAVLVAWLLGLGLLSALDQIHGGGLDLFNIGESADASVTALDWLLVQSAAAVRSLVLLVLPLGLTVDFDYDIVPMGIRWFAFSLLVALSVHVWFLRRVWPMGAFCGAAMLLVLLPRLFVQTPRGILNDHQVYLWLPFAGILAAAGLEALRARAEGLRSNRLSKPHARTTLFNVRASGQSAEASSV